MTLTVGIGVIGMGWIGAGSRARVHQVQPGLADILAVVKVLAAIEVSWSRCREMVKSLM